jgi:phosphotriesterase-related protein
MANVMTVCAPISPEALGVTMSHVHLLVALTVAEQKPLQEVMTASERALRDKPVTMDILGVIRRHAYAVNDDLLLGDVDEAIREIMLYKRMGGDSLVETTLVGIGRDPIGLKQISRATGVNIICATGWYIAASHPALVKESGMNELCDYMVRELTTEIDATGIKAGVIKAACSGRTPEVAFTGDEEKVLRAAARAQTVTGAAMTIHPSHHSGRARHYHTYLDIIKEEGGNLEKVYLSHMERCCKDIDYEKSVLDRGVTLAYDQFGSEQYVRPGYSKPTDESRVAGIVDLLKAGYVNQVMLSNEVLRKTGLRKFGGYGYAHVLENIVPDLRYYGVTQEQLNTMLVENPMRLLPF